MKASICVRREAPAAVRTAVAIATLACVILMTSACKDEPGTQSGAAGMAGTGGATANPMAGAMAAPAGSGGVAAPSGVPTFSAIFREILTVGAVGNCCVRA